MEKYKCVYLFLISSTPSQLATEISMTNAKLKEKKNKGEMKQTE